MKNQSRTHVREDQLFSKIWHLKKNAFDFFQSNAKKKNFLKKVWSKIEKIWSNLIDLIFMLNSKSIEFDLFDFWKSNLTPIWLKIKSRSPPHLAIIWLFADDAGI